jgi:hypothetical protein
MYVRSRLFYPAMPAPRIDFWGGITISDFRMIRRLAEDRP